MRERDAGASPRPKRPGTRYETGGRPLKDRLQPSKTRFGQLSLQTVRSCIKWLRTRHQGKRVGSAAWQRDKSGRDQIAPRRSGKAAIEHSGDRDPALGARIIAFARGMDRHGMSEARSI